MPTLAQRCILTKGSQTEWIRIRFPCFPFQPWSIRSFLYARGSRTSVNSQSLPETSTMTHLQSPFLNPEGIDDTGRRAQNAGSPSREVGSCINPQLAFVHKVKLSQGRRNERIMMRWHFPGPFVQIDYCIQEELLARFLIGNRIQKREILNIHIPVETRWVPVGALLPNGFVQKWGYLNPLKLGMLSMEVPHFRKPIHPSDEFPSRHVKEVCSRVSEVQTVTSPETVPKPRTWGTEDQLGSLVPDSLVWININKSGMMCICGYSLIYAPNN